MPTKKVNVSTNNFERARFIVSVEVSKLDDILVKGLVADIDVSERCGGMCSNAPDLIRVYNNTDISGITARMCIERLIDAGYENRCRHFYLESFTLNQDGNLQIFWGS